MEPRELGVYLFTGFLESGKTKFIQESMEDKKFNSGEKTMLLVCEEGIEEYDPTRFFGQNVYFESISDPSELTEENLTKLAAKHDLDRVIVEYNGMWSVKDFYNAMPEGWAIYQQLMFADSTTFKTYNANMRQLVVDKLTDAEMVVFNRADSADKEEFHKIVRGVSRRAQIVYDYPNGEIEYDDIEDPLPFDKEAPVIEIADEDFAMWYRDLGEDMPFYNGRTVKVKGMVGHAKGLPSNMFILGRHIMTCCAADIQYNGLACRVPDASNLKDGDWVTVTAKITLERCKIYKSKGPVLNADGTSFAVKPQEEVCTFY